MKKRLTELLNTVKAIQVTGKAELNEIDNISINSNNVKKGTIFFAIKGYKTDGHNFIIDAINNGASAVVLQDNNFAPEQLFIHSGCVKILVENSRKALSDISAALYNYPTKNLKLIGITGTKGKTTTTNFIKSVFGNSKCGLIGTIKIELGNKQIESKLTTPEANDLNKYFSEMLSEGCNAAVMEVSSHSLELHRVDNLDFDIAIFTNLAHDHLDFHGTIENYLLAKKKLFDNLKPEAIAIVNADDKASKKLVKNCKAKIFTYGFNKNADFRIVDVTYSLNGTIFNVMYNNCSYKLETTLIGVFNAYNACSAFAAGVLSGIEIKKVIKLIKQTKQVPGRFEVISKGNKKAVVDYSHTPESLEHTLKAIKEINKNNYPIYTVFGCGGDRDKTKRPIMGNIASEYSTMAIVTSDNPRTEDPKLIIEDIVRGINKNNYKMFVDREDAIKFAIVSSPEKAIVLVAGKGHEDYIEINGVRTHFSDKEKV
ncbi:MAG TPA: UDP-N-acetylmuramoyl-L-alanyl-D-glutamate--2,6-diaminopimelate ligase, partial [Melioribacteraceae bacterium]|nr:UDP-N-acetylmuramoyl-L-alanyl-D-glutamate--2,6-diaminopimelate ligase [Melioribacteraceae bacterium]